MEIIYGDICNLKVDAIVNASNGMGYMGGLLCRHVKLNGLAENINYITKGTVEKEARQKCKLKSYLPRIIVCKSAGEVFHTSSGSLKSKHIIHAITMKYPGTRSKLETIRKLLPEIINEAYTLNCKTIAIPLLGTGMGGLKENEVLEIYEEYFKEIYDLNIIVVIYKS